MRPIPELKAAASWRRPGWRRSRAVTSSTWRTRTALTPSGSSPRPLDAENLMANYYKRWHEGLYRTTGNFEGMANIMSFAELLRSREQLPERALPVLGRDQPQHDRERVRRRAGARLSVHAGSDACRSTLLGRMDEGLTLGTPGRDARYRAFGEFLRGVSLGYAALFYDSAAVDESGDRRRGRWGPGGVHDRHGLRARSLAAGH